MPRGGARVGAGRKPAAKRQNVVAFEPIRPVSDKKLLEPPAFLPESGRALWALWAPLALELKTLTVHHVPAFALLCRLQAEMDATGETIERDGRTQIRVTIDGSGQEHQELKAHPLKPDYRQLAQRVESLLARFCLAPFGKPGTGAVKTGAKVNPWAGIGSR